ncbi:PepSY domain-containing protein [Rhodospirillaceae bacterium KN72]|uniref:PepSY domain-containing protein n=1 Tax=Pacificispira spongiicola TaxID=2729598 RepID=A0A7Y0E2M7_9PROT|nr:PepSY domain-containing protein [Pacificispira spongiicola]NMM46099.1 PepSY domain-containing protein [Pacificispira spongiicola]
MTKKPSAAAVNTPLYRAVWRWHFYAGLIVLPFMILLAVTGGLYLFKDEINDAFYSDLRRVEPAATAFLTPSELTASALTAHPGKLKAYLPPAAPDRAAQIRIATEDGQKNVVYVNPYSGAVLGSDWDAGFAGSPLMWTIRKLHSLEYVGWLGNRVIECVAGWAILLTVTGVYLWWPRGRKEGVLKPRLTRGRTMWRDFHAVTGIYAAAFIVFLATTGLPWSGYWGKNFYDLSYSAGLGMPDGYWDKYPTSTVLTGEALDRAPWILENQPMPLSKAAEGIPAGLDAVVRIVEDMGIHPGYALSMPNGPTGVFTASVYPDDITYERVIHLDQYTGEVLFDMGLADLGALGRAAEWGISVHMGQEFGTANQIAMLLACIVIVLMAISAIVMWWKRRPVGSLGAPRVPADWRIPRAILGIAVVAGLFFPLVGLSMLVALTVELLLTRVMQPKPA